MTRLEESDIADEAMVSERELVSIGTLGAPYRTIPITGVVSGVVTANIAIPIEEYDDPVAPGDIFVLTGSTAGDGAYTIFSVSGFTFTVEEPVVDSTGGSGGFFFAPGARLVGVDSSVLTSSTSSDLQSVLSDFDGVISGGLPAPQEPCVIFYSEDGVSWDQVVPVAGNGILVNNNGELVYKG